VNRWDPTGLYETEYEDDGTVIAIIEDGDTLSDIAKDEVADKTKWDGNMKYEGSDEAITADQAGQLNVGDRIDITGIYGGDYKNPNPNAPVSVGQQCADDAVQFDKNVKYDFSGAAGIQKIDPDNPPAKLDCSAFVGSVIFTVTGVNPGRTTWDQCKQGTPVDKNDLQPGDVIFFNTTNNPPGHEGMYIGNGQFVHSGSSTGVTVSNLDSYWTPMYMYARRIP